MVVVSCTCAVHGGLRERLQRYLRKGTLQSGEVVRNEMQPQMAFFSYRMLLWVLILLRG